MCSPVTSQPIWPGSSLLLSLTLPLSPMPAFFSVQRHRHRSVSSSLRPGPNGSVVRTARSSQRKTQGAYARGRTREENWRTRRGKKKMERCWSYSIPVPVNLRDATKRSRYSSCRPYDSLLSTDWPDYLLCAHIFIVRTTRRDRR